MNQIKCLSILILAMALSFNLLSCKNNNGNGYWEDKYGNIVLIGGNNMTITMSEYNDITGENEFNTQVYLVTDHHINTVNPKLRMFVLKNAHNHKISFISQQLNEDRTCQIDLNQIYMEGYFNSQAALDSAFNEREIVHLPNNQSMDVLARDAWMLGAVASNVFTKQ